MANQAQYNHISSFVPTFQTSVNNVARLRKNISFSDDVVPDEETNTLSTSLLYALGSNVYEVVVELPLQDFFDPSDLLEDSDEEKEKADDSKMDIDVVSSKPKAKNDYGKAFAKAEEKPLPLKWQYQGETITKLLHITSEPADSAAICMASNGSLAWFREGVKVPVHIMQEMMGPGTSFSSIHSTKGSEFLAVSDFDLSADGETLVKSQANGSAEESILKLIDNSGKPGELLRKVNVPGTTVTHAVRFIDNHVFTTCSDDNVVRFWDTRTGCEPLYVLADPNNGLITSFDVSPIASSLFATGSDTGIVKLWDARAVSSAVNDLSNRQNGEDPIQTEIVSLHHAGGDSVMDVRFSEINATEFLTTGAKGDVYHWDMSPYMSDFDDDDDKFINLEASEEINTKCLKFFHRGNFRGQGGRGMVSWHPMIDQLVGCVDEQGRVSVYKPYVETTPLTE